MTTYDDLEKLLHRNRAASLPPDSRTPAAVALILRIHCGTLEVLFVERATCHDDPWSGDLGFPGGKIETGDASTRRAAERETLEEIGIDLTAARFLGRLGEIVGAHLPVRVSCFVYGLRHPVSLTLQHEIRRAFWVPLDTLRDPERHLEAPVNFGGESLLRPAIRILEPGRTVLWGLTYRLVCQFLDLLGRHVQVDRLKAGD